VSKREWLVFLVGEGELKRQLTEKGLADGALELRAAANVARTDPKRVVRGAQ